MVPDMPDPSLPPLWVVPAAFVVSLVGSLGGLSGAFLLVPFQVSMLGIAGPVVTPTNHLFNVVAIPAGLAGLWRRGRVLRPLAAVVVAGTVPGVVAGAWLRVRWLADPAVFQVFAGVLMAVMGVRLVARTLGWRRGRTDRAPPVRIEALGWTARTIALRIDDREVAVGTPELFAASLVVGALGGAYGIGGGAILAPFLVTAFDLPVHATAGATLLGTLVTSAAAVAVYAVLGGCLGMPGVAPDWILGGLLGLGGMAGVAAGTRLQARVRSSWIELLIGILVAGLAVRYLVGGLGALAG